MRKLHFALAVLLFCVLLGANAQTANVVNQNWVLTSGSPSAMFDYQASHVDASHNLIVIGNTFHSGQQENFLIRKYNPSGVLLWSKEYDGTLSGIDFATDVTTQDTNIYVTGVEGDTTLHTSSITTLKLNGSGSIIWTVKYAGSYHGYNIPARINAITGASKIWVTGTSQTGATDFQMVTIMYNSSGVQQWVNTYDSVGLYDGGADLVLGTSSSVTTYGVSGLSTNSGDFVTQTINASGTTTGLKRVNNTNSYITKPIAMVKDASENIYITGVVQTSPNNTDIKVVKLDSQLVVRWTKVIDGGANKNDEVTGMKIDLNGNLVLTGFAAAADTSKSAWTIRMRDSVIVWNKKYYCPISGKDAKAASIDLDSLGQIYVTGKVYNGGNFDDLTLSYDTSGNVRWQKNFALNGSANDAGNNIIVDSGGYVYVNGLSTTGTSNTYHTIRYSQDKIYTAPDSTVPKLQFAYFENMGQIIDTGRHQASYVRFYTNYSANPKVYINNSGISYVYYKKDSLLDSLQRIDLTLQTSKSGHAVNTSPVYYGSEQVAPFLNYYNGALPKYYEGIHGYERVTAKSIYPNIDWQLYSDSSGLKYYYVVNAGGSPTDIQFVYNGADSIKSDTSGLKIYSKHSVITQKPFTAWQYSGSTATQITLTFTALGSNAFTFSVGTYNTSLPLVIRMTQQPQQAQQQSNGNLNWSTYLGGSGDDWAKDIDIDNHHQQYVTGTSTSPNFPTAYNVVYRDSTGNLGSFLSKFDSSSVLQYSTYYGGSTPDSSANPNIKHSTNAVAAGIWNGSDAQNQKVYIGGQTIYKDLPTPLNYLLPTGLHDTVYNGLADGFIALFNGFNGSLIQASYIGSNGEDGINTLEIDMSSRNPNTLYVGGYTMGSNFPYQNSFSGNFYDNQGRGVLMQLDANMNQVWTTGFGSHSLYFNGSGDSLGCTINDIKLDNSGNILIVGNSYFTFPTASPYNISMPNTNSLFISAHPNTSTTPPTSAFLAKFTPVSGSTNKYSLYYFSEYGDNEQDDGEKICSNSTGDIYIAGNGFRNNVQGDTSFDYITSGNGSDGGYIVRFSHDGILLANGDYGGVANITFGDLFCDASDNVFAYGATGPNTLLFSLLQQTNWYWDNYTANKCFLAEVSPSNTMVWSTFFGGGTRKDFQGGMCIDGNGLYVCGKTTTNDQGIVGQTLYPLLNNNVSTFFGTYGGSTTAFGGDAYVAKFNLLDVHPTSIADVNSTTSNIKCYPNPSNGRFRVSFPDFDNGDKTVTLYNYLGQSLFAANTSNNIIEINGAEKFATGVYIVEVRSNTKKEVVKIVISQ